MDGLKNWNPMEEDFKNRRVNSYREGVGQDLQSRDMSDVASYSGTGGQQPVVLYVTNIPLEMDEIALQNIFEQEGKVIRAHMPVPSAEKVAQFKSKMAFVTMANVRGAQAAIENLHGFQVRGRTLSVKVKQTKEELARRKEKLQRMEEFSRTMTPEDQTIAGPSGAVPPQGASGAGESQGNFRNTGPRGDAASVGGNLSVTVGQNNRRVQDAAQKGGLLPLPTARGAAAASSHLQMSPALPAGRHSSLASSISGKEVGSDQCANCRQPALMRCMACRKVYYCNAVCQRAHWGVHRQTCSYENSVPTVPAAKHHRIPEPDFDNLDVDVSEDFIKNNEEYLKEWLKASIQSDSSSSSGDRLILPNPQSLSSPQFFPFAKPPVPTARPDPDGERRQQKNGQPGQDTSAGQQHRRTGPQGMEGRDSHKPLPSAARRQDTSVPAQPGPGSQNGDVPRDRPEQVRKDGAGVQQGKKGGPPPHHVQGDRPGSFQSKRDPEPRKGPVPFQPKSRPQDEGRNNQFRNGPRQVREGADFQGPRNMGDKPNDRRGEGFPPRQNRGGPPQGRGEQEPYGPRTQKPEGGRGPPASQQNERQPGRNFGQREFHRGPPRNDRGPGRQPPERGNNKRQKKPPSGRRSDTGSSCAGDGAESWEEETVKSPMKPNTSPNSASPKTLAAASQERSAQRTSSGVSSISPKAGNTSSSTVSSSAVPASATSPKAGDMSSAAVSQALAPMLHYREPRDLVEMNTPITVLVSHIDSPQRFWVHIAEQLTTFVPFFTEVFSSYTGRDRPATRAEVGQMFLCEYMDELARAKVISTAGCKVKIFYMDYGNSEEVQVSQLLPVPDDLVAVPAQSLQCGLAVCPPEGGEWGQEVVAQMQAVFSCSEPCTLTVLSKRSDHCQVTLVRKSDGLDAAHFLKEKGFGVDPAQVASAAKQTSRSDPGVLPPASRTLVTAMDSVKDKLSVGQQVDVLLIQSDDPMNMFVHIAHLEQDFSLFSVKITALYNEDPATAYQPVVGEMVVGRYSSDNCWYRAEVLNVSAESREASLFYVDFGNKEQLPFEEIRALKAEHAALPIHGVLCAVGGISTSAVSQWPEDQLTVFINCLAKYLRPDGEEAMCTMVVESVEDGRLWVDIVSEGLQTKLSEELAQVLDEDALPQPLQPQVLSPAGHTPTTLPPTALEEKPSSKQSDVMVGVSSPAQLQKVVLPVGQSVEVGIQNIESCHKFYVNTLSAEEDLDTMRERLTALCEGDRQSRPPSCTSVSPGDVVLVQFSEDHHWYRGEVQHLSDDCTTCTVFFLDYGNKEDREVASLRVVPPEFLKLPAQAVMCELAGVPRPASEEVQSRFSLLLLTRVVIKVVKREGQCCVVEVFTDNNTSFLTLIGLQTASPLTLPQPVPEDKQVAPSTPCPPLEGPEDRVVPHGSSPCLPEERREAARTVLTRDCLPMVSEDAVEFDRMLVTHVVSPAHFYVSIFQHYEAQYAPDGLAPQLQEVNSACPPLNHMPAVGELLSGLFEGEWYRCEVREVTSPQVRVFFFDYGNEAELDLAHLRPLPDKLCYNYPLASLRCCLEGVGPVSGEVWDEDAVTLTQELLLNQGVSVAVRRKAGEVHHVAVTRMDSGEDVGQLLIQSGKAVSQSTPPPPPQHQEQLSREELLRQMEEIQAKLAAMPRQEKL